MTHKIYGETKKIYNTKIGRVQLVTAFLVFLILAPTIVQADINNKVIPIDSKPYGSTYGEWSATWWQWTVGISKDKNPLLDTTGEFCAEGQSGNVWFLAGIIGSSEPVSRNCTIPAGKAIFVPIVNQFDCCEEGQTVADMRKNVTLEIDNVTNMDFKIDGVPIQNLFRYRAASPVFDLNLPDNNIFGVPAGIYGPTVSDGYWLMLAPLSAGQHTIDFAATVSDNPPFGPFDIDVHYNIQINK